MQFYCVMIKYVLIKDMMKMQFLIKRWEVYYMIKFPTN